MADQDRRLIEDYLPIRHISSRVGFALPVPSCYNYPKAELADLLAL
jgi:hypothetical protein